MACVFDDHSAYAQSIFGLQKDEKRKTEGELVYPKGQKNFGLLGLDPCFKPNCNNKACAEMEEDEKNKISHRGKSSKAFVNWLKKKNKIYLNKLK